VRNERPPHERFFSEQDDEYIADIPDLPHCAAFGETPEQALAEVLKAKAARIDAARAEGKPIPPPSFRPVIYQVSKVLA
jgi:predicted RNase H-like HicB family nuclease